MTWTCYLCDKKAETVFPIALTIPVPRSDKKTMIDAYVCKECFKKKLNE